MILDGKIIAGNIYNTLSQKIEQLKSVPTLGAILVGDSAASLRYIGQKRKFARKIGMELKLFQFDENISEEDLKSEIISLNHNGDISGYIVQLPLPEHINPLRIIRNIDPQKDVDGFHPENIGKIMIGDTTGFSPCTPAGIMKIFEHYNISLSGKEIAVLGQSNIVGKPITQMCINAGATVASCNHMTPDISVYTKDADIIISATGHVGLLTPDIVKKDAVIIDVGFSVVDGEIFGDAQYDALFKQGNKITPVPGGVGPMTVAMLLSNTLDAHLLSHD